MVKVAVGQLRIDEGDVDTNARRCALALDDAAAAGADVLVLPECALTGYQFASRESAWAASITVDDPRLQALRDAAARLQVTVVVGLLERAGDTWPTAPRCSLPTAGPRPCARLISRSSAPTASWCPETASVR